MKLAIIGPAYPYRGGIALHTNLLYKEFQKEHTVRIINYKKLYPDIIFPGKTQYEENDSFKHLPSVRLIDALNPISWHKTANYILSNSYDLIIIQFWQPFFAIQLSAIVRKIKHQDSHVKVIILCHNISPHEGSPLDKTLTRFLFKTADGFVIQSKAGTDDLLRIIPHAKYAYNPHPIYDIFGTPQKKSTARKTLNLDPHEPIILYFGYVREYKGLEYLIEAFPTIYQQTGGQLLIVGEFYKNKKKYLQLIAANGIQDKVVVLDKYIPNELVNIYFSAADILVLPYVSATQSGITQIALSYGLPCVVTNVGGLPEVIKPNKTGFVVPPRDPDAIAQAVIHYLTQSNRAAIRAHILQEKERYSWHTMKNTLITLYQDISR